MFVDVNCYCMVTSTRAGFTVTYNFKKPLPLVSFLPESSAAQNIDTETYVSLFTGHKSLSIIFRIWIFFKSLQRSNSN